MGGRTSTPENRPSDAEQWIQDVSDTRLAAYERLMHTPAAPYREDGEKRIDQGDYFRDLIHREQKRRKSE